MILYHEFMLFGLIKYGSLLRLGLQRAFYCPNLILARNWHEKGLGALYRDNKKIIKKNKRVGAVRITV